MDSMSQSSLQIPRIDPEILKWNDSKKEYPLRNKCLHELIHAQTRRTPSRPAVCFNEFQLSYSELNERANRCAHYLRGLGVGPGVVVGILMERSLEMVVGLLGILKSGGAYLPLEPAFPEDRLRFILEDAATSIVLTQGKFKNVAKEIARTSLELDDDLIRLEQEATNDPECIAAPADIAYVIYTSGSTGKPKGCMVSHRAICNRLLWMQEQYRLTTEDRVLQKTPFTFDVSLWEFFWPLLSGACMVVAKPNGHKDSDYLVKKIQEEAITTCHFVPSMLRFFLSNKNVDQCESLRQVFTSGEALAFDLMMKFKEMLPAKLHNLYGPTEAAVDVTYWECEERSDKKVPIGRPIANIQTFILDENLHPVEIGDAGGAVYWWNWACRWLSESAEINS